MFLQSTLPMLLTAEQAARELGIGRTRLFDLIKSGELQSVKIGASRRVPHASLVAYVEKLQRSAGGGD